MQTSWGSEIAARAGQLAWMSETTRIRIRDDSRGIPRRYGSLARPLRSSKAGGRAWAPLALGAEPQEHPARDGPRLECTLGERGPPATRRRAARTDRVRDDLGGINRSFVRRRSSGRTRAGTSGASRG